MSTSFEIGLMVQPIVWPFEVKGRILTTSVIANVTKHYFPNRFV